ncbi:AMP-binding protein [Desulfuromonas versatilis]|nr:AMP-binding protein [Desulfuromonas versatilis]
MTQKLHFTLGTLLEDTARRFPEREALVYPERGLRLSYRELDEQCSRVAKGLLALGVNKGDHLALWATNIPEWVVLMFAAGRIGAVLVTVDTNCQAAELEYALRQSDASLLLMSRGVKDTDYSQVLTQVIPEFPQAAATNLASAKLPKLKRVIFLGEPAPCGALSYQDLQRLGEKVTDRSLAEAQRNASPDDVANIQFTSAAAGIPKGVMLTHYQIINNAFRVARRLKFSERDRLCIPVPFFHCFGCVLGILGCVTHGAAMIPLETYSTEALLRAVSAERCTSLFGVPTMFIAALDHPEFSRYEMGSMRTGIMAGAPCPIEAMNRVIKDMHAREVTIGYGQTEAAPIITQTETDDPVQLRVSTVGRPLPGVEVRIIDPATGNACPPGQSGEICARGDMVMHGYYKMPEETARTIDAEGWLHTGDLAVMDANGYYRITGRLKKMIIRGGQNIYPAEVEQFLQTHPGIAEVRVYGKPDPKLGEIVAADVKLAKDGGCSAEDIRRFCEGRIARYKIPAVINMID